MKEIIKNELKRLETEYEILDEKILKYDDDEYDEDDYEYPIEEMVADLQVFSFAISLLRNILRRGGENDI